MVKKNVIIPRPIGGTVWPTRLGNTTTEIPLFFSGQMLRIDHNGTEGSPKLAAQVTRGSMRLAKFKFSYNFYKGLDS